MQFKSAVLAALVITLAPVEGMADSPAVVNRHYSFDDLAFIKTDDVVERSGLKTIEDRGLSIVDGKFGSALTVTKPPRIGLIDNMTGIDLDLVTAVVYNTRHTKQWDLFNEPIFWGAGGFNPDRGSAAFWMKGGAPGGILFEQAAMAWGRKEKYLLGIELDADGKPFVYLVDSRYVRHEIHAEKVWDAEAWHHVVLNWDKADGLELFIDGASAASSWRMDSWWMTPLPGMQHLPMPKAVYDEFYLFSRPLDESEIARLMSANEPPTLSSFQHERSTAERDRLADASGYNLSLKLPVVAPSRSGRILSFKEITPEYMGDGHVPGRFCCDGRYELAWPNRFASFTIIPGDADFVAEKLDVRAPANVPFNYVSIEGNMTGMSLTLFNAVKEKDHFTGRAFFPVYQDNRFFYSTVVDRAPYPQFTLPFLKGYGAPDEFSGDVKLPLNGETRIHEVGLFDVTELTAPPSADMKTYPLKSGGELTHRYQFALNSLAAPMERTLLTASDASPAGQVTWQATGYLTRSNIVTVPVTERTCIGGILLDLSLKARTSEDILVVRLHDPGLPHRIWTHAEVKLKDFNIGGRVRLLLEPPPLVLAPGDIVWLDIMTYDNALIAIGGADGSKLGLIPASFEESAKAYEYKALMPAMAEFTKAYHHRPWSFEQQWPDIDNPHTFGGQFDSVVPAIAVKRNLPDSFLANFYIEWAGPKYYWGSFVDAEKNFPIKDIAVPSGVPRWAHLQHLIQEFRWRVTDYIVANQNPNGELWGGWNDDTLVLRGRPDVPLDSNPAARDMFLKVYEGLDNTNLFGKGYCQISPIDNLHNGDFVRERFRANIFMLGDPHIYRRSLETAWHYGKPDQTPINYGNGVPFTFDKGILDWYWGDNMPDKAYTSPDEATFDEKLSRLASYCDETLYYRFTGARVHTDATRIYNEEYIMRMVLGGDANQTISIAWPEGGGPDISRWVTYADSTRLACRMYSFDANERKVVARLFRIGYGDYQITLAEDNNGTPGAVISTEKKRLSRFDAITLAIPSKKPVILEVKQMKRRKIKPLLPDLAVASYDCDRKENTLSVRVSNLGDGKSGKTSVVVYDESGRTLGKAKVPAIEPAGDYVAKTTWVDIMNLPRKGTLTVVVDPGNKQREIFEENNSAVIK